MADINSYALSLEFTLQSNAEEVLRGVSSQIETIEGQISKAISNIVKMSSSVGSGISDTVSQTISNIQKAGMAATDSAKQAVAATQLEQKAIEQAGAAKAAISAQQQSDQEAYQNQLKYAHNVIEQMTKKELVDNKKLGLLNKVRNLASKKYLEFKTKLFKISKSMLDKKFKPPVEAYKEITQQAGISNKLLVAMRISLGYIYTGLIKIVGLISTGILKGLSLAKGLVLDIWSGIGKLAGMLSKAMNLIGLGPLLELLSISGMYAATIGKAAEEEERFHTANFRAVGSMQELQSSVTKTAPDINMLRGEVLEATVALREMGASKDEMESLRGSVSALERTTGATTQSWAQFAKTMTVVTGQTSRAENEMWRFHRGAKDLRLAGRDLDAILQAASDSAFMLGSRGQLYGSMYNKILLQAAGAAKKLGLASGEAVNMVASLADPLNAVTVLGAVARNMDPAQRMQALGAAAQDYMTRLKSLSGAQQDTLKREILARWSKLGINNYADIEKGLQKYIETAKMAGKVAEADVVDPQKRIQEAIEESSGLIRKVTLLIDKIVSRLIEAFKPIKKEVESFVQTLLDADIDVTVGGWATAFTTYSMIIVDKIKELGKNLYDKFLAWFEKSTLKETLESWRAKFDNFVQSIKAMNIGAIVAKFAEWAKWGMDIAKSIQDFVKEHPTLIKIAVIAAGLAVSFAALAASPLIVIAAGLAAAATYAYDLWTATDKAVISMNKMNNARIDATRRLENERKILHDIYELDIRRLKVQKAKLIAENKGKQATDQIKQLEATITDLQLKQGTHLQSNLEKYNKIDAEYKKAVASGDKDAAQKAAIAREAVRMDKSVEEMMKDQKTISELTKETTDAIKKKLDTQTQAEEQAKKAAAEAAKAKIDAEKKAADAVQQKIDKEKQAQEAAKDTALATQEQGPYLKIAKDEAAGYLKQLQATREGSLEHMLLKEDIANKVGGSVNFLEKDLQEVMNYVAKKAEPETEKVAQLTVPPQKVEGETLATAKMDNQTAKPMPIEDPVVKEAQKQNENLAGIMQQMNGKGTIADLITLLNTYLPVIAEKDTGLASSANQWYPA